MLSPQPTKAQVQTCKTLLLFANEEHGRVKQMYDYKRRKKNKLNSSNMHRALCCTCSLKFPPFFPLPPTNPNQFCYVTWPLLPSSPISLLLIVVIFYSPVFVKCCLSCLPICTSSVRTLSVNFLLWPPPVCANNLSVELVVAYSSRLGLILGGSLFYARVTFETLVVFSFKVP